MKKEEQKTFRINFTTQDTGCVYVEAKNETAAKRKALKIIENGEGDIIETTHALEIDKTHKNN
ncbi:MAG: hypothetical protein WC069_05810 [Candidatus Shapirobacteria bacterium]